MGDCRDGALEMLVSRSEFVARMKQKSPNAVGIHCTIRLEALASRTLPAIMNDKLVIAVCVVNFAKTSSVKSKLFIALGKNMDADHQTLLFHTNI